MRSTVARSRPRPGCAPTWPWLGRRVTPHPLLFVKKQFTEHRFPLVRRCTQCNIAAYIFENRSQGEREALSGWNFTSGAAGLGLLGLAGNRTPGRGNRRRSRRDHPAARGWNRCATERRGCFLRQREPRQRPRVQLLCPVQEQVLCRGVLLQQRLRGNLRDLLADAVARHVHEGRGGRQAERPHSMPHRPESGLRSGRYLRRQGGLQALFAGHDLHPGDLPGRRGRRHLRLQWLRRLPPGRDLRLRALRLQHDHQSMQGGVQLRCGLRLPRQVSRRKLRTQTHRRFLRGRRRMRLGALRRRSLLQHSLRRRLSVLRSGRIGGDLHTDPDRPATPALSQARPHDVRNDRDVRRSGGLPPLSRQHRLRSSGLRRHQLGQVYSDLRRPRNLSDRQDLQLRKLRLHARRLHRLLLQPDRLRAGAYLHHPDRELGWNLRPESARPVLQGRRRLHERALRGRRLLRHHLHGGLSQLRDPRLARNLYVDRRRRGRSACGLQGPDGRDVRDGRQVRRRGRLPKICGGHGLRARDLLWEQLHAAVDLQRLRHLRSTKRHQLQPVPVQRHRLLCRLQHRHAVCVAQHLRNERRRRLLRNEAQRPTLLEQQPVHQRAVCPGRLLRHALQHRLSRLQHRR